MALLVEYGRQRSVKVMIEFDMPGHAGSWCVGYPEICPSPKCKEPLNPASNATFTLIESLLGECTGYKSGQGLFPYNMLHLGGDEVRVQLSVAIDACFIIHYHAPLCR